MKTLQMVQLEIDVASDRFDGIERPHAVGRNVIDDGHVGIDRGGAIP